MRISDWSSDVCSSDLLDETSTLANATLGDLDLGEDIASGYAMANLDFGSITVTPGIRVERTDLTIRGFQLENETDVVAVNAKRSEESSVGKEGIRRCRSRWSQVH